MSALITLTDPATISMVHAQVFADGGIINTLNDQTNQLFVLVKNVGGLAILLGFLFIAHKARFAAGAIIGGLIMCGLIFFALNGGLAWIGSQFSTQFSSTSGLAALPLRSLV